MSSKSTKSGKPKTKLVAFRPKVVHGSDVVMNRAAGGGGGENQGVSRRRHFLTMLMNQVGELAPGEALTDAMRNQIRDYARNSSRSEEAFISLLQVPPEHLMALLTRFMENVDTVSIDRIMEEFQEEMPSDELDWKQLARSVEDYGGMEHEMRVRSLLRAYVRRHLSLYLDPIPEHPTDKPIKEVFEDLEKLFPMPLGSRAGGRRKAQDVHVGVYPFDRFYQRVYKNEKDDVGEIVVDELMIPSHEIKRFLAETDLCVKGKLNLRLAIHKFIQQHQFDRVKEVLAMGIRPTDPLIWAKYLPENYMKSFPPSLWTLSSWDIFQDILDKQQQFSMPLEQLLQTFYMNNSSRGIIFRTNRVNCTDSTLLMGSSFYTLPELRQLFKNYLEDPSLGPTVQEMMEVMEEHLQTPFSKWSKENLVRFLVSVRKNPSLKDRVMYHDLRFEENVQKDEEEEEDEEEDDEEDEVDEEDENREREIIELTDLFTMDEEDEEEGRGGGGGGGGRGGGGRSGGDGVRSILRKALPFVRGERRQAFLEELARMRKGKLLKKKGSSFRIVPFSSTSSDFSLRQGMVPGLVSFLIAPTKEGEAQRYLGPTFRDGFHFPTKAFFKDLGHNGLDRTWDQDQGLLSIEDGNTTVRIMSLVDTSVHRLISFANQGEKELSVRFRSRPGFVSLLIQPVIEEEDKSMEYLGAEQRDGYFFPTKRFFEHLVAPNTEVSQDETGIVELNPGGKRLRMFYLLDDGGIVPQPAVDLEESLFPENQKITIPKWSDYILGSLLVSLAEKDLEFLRTRFQKLIAMFLTTQVFAMGKMSVDTHQMASTIEAGLYEKSQTTRDYMTNVFEILFHLDPRYGFHQQLSKMYHHRLLTQLYSLSQLSSLPTRFGFPELMVVPEAEQHLFEKWKTTHASSFMKDHLHAMIRIHYPFFRLPLTGNMVMIPPPLKLVKTVQQVRLDLPDIENVFNILILPTKAAPEFVSLSSLATALLKDEEFLLSDGSPLDPELLSSVALSFDLERCQAGMIALWNDPSSSSSTSLMEVLPSVPETENDGVVTSSLPRFRDHVYTLLDSFH